MLELKLIGKESPIPRGGCNFLQYDKGKYMVIGGVNRSEEGLKELNDFWTLHLPFKDGNLAGIWQETKLTNQNIYTPRSSQAACITDEKMIYIFGGQKFLDSQSTDEFFQIDPINKVLTIVQCKNKPKPRNSHTLNYSDGKLFLFGGANENGPLNDLQIFDLSSQIWQKVAEIQELLLPREMHTSHIVKWTLKPTKKSMQYQEQNKIVSVFNELNSEPIQNIAQIEQVQQIEAVQQPDVQEQVIQQNDQKEQSYLLIIGGRNKNELLRDVSVINLETFEVDQIENLENCLCAHTSVQINSDIYIFGGFYESQLNENIYQLHDQSLKKAGKLQIPIMASSGLYSQELDKIIIFGGCTLEKDLNQTYIVKL